MTLTFTVSEIRSDQTPHTAKFNYAYYGTPEYPRGTERWRVSWLPDRDLNRNQAITAMTLAETVAQMQEDGLTQVVDHTHRLWPHIDDWATELGLTGPHAVVLVSESAAKLAGVVLP